MKQATKRFLSIVVGILFLSGAVVVYAYSIRPVYKDIKTLQGETQSKRDFIETQEGVVEQVKNLIAEYKGGERLQDVISRVLPLEQDLSGALAQVYGLSRINNMTVNSISFQEVGVERVAARTRQQKKEAASPTLVKPLGSIGVTVDADGDYEGLKSLIQTFETNNRIFEVKQLGIRPIITRSGDLTFGFTISLVTYYQKL